MQFLLDTHVWLWAGHEPDRLNKSVLRRLDDARHERWVSPVSFWELLVLSRAGRLKNMPSVEAWVGKSKLKLQLRDADLTFDVVREALTFRLPHQDPADNLIVATARHYKLTLVTADQRIIDSGAVEVLAAR